MSSELKKASVGPAFIGGIFIFLVFGLLVVIWFRLSGKPQSFDDERAVVRAAKLDQLQKDNHEKLTSYAWVNKQKGIVQLPIDRAMDLVVAELKAKPVKPSAVKLEVPYPAGLQAAPVAPAAVSGTAAPGASPAAAPAASGTAPAAPSAAPASSAAPAASASPAPSAAPSGTSAPAAPAPSPAPAATPAPAVPAPAAAATPVTAPPSPAPSATTTPAQ